jgi:hypothetical protein
VHWDLTYGSYDTHLTHLRATNPPTPTGPAGPAGPDRPTEADRSDSAPGPCLPTDLAAELTGTLALEGDPHDPGPPRP